MRRCTIPKHHRRSIRCSSVPQKKYVVLCCALFAVSRSEELPATAGPANLPDADVSPQVPGRRTPRAHSIGLSMAYQAPLTLDKSVPFGGGVSFTRDYFVAPRTALGVHGALRVFPSSPSHFALGYGLNFKHYVGDYGNSARDGLYLLYGLLLQMNYLQGVAGSATGHDTRLALGFDWCAEPWWPLVEVGYHLTQVRAFDRDTLWWPYTELVFGFRL